MLQRWWNDWMIILYSSTSRKFSSDILRVHCAAHNPWHAVAEPFGLQWTFLYLQAEVDCHSLGRLLRLYLLVAFPCSISQQTLLWNRPLKSTCLYLATIWKSSSQDQQQRSNHCNSDQPKCFRNAYRQLTWIDSANTAIHDIKSMVRTTNTIMDWFNDVWMFA